MKPRLPSIVVFLAACGRHASAPPPALVTSTPEASSTTSAHAGSAAAPANRAKAVVARPKLRGGERGQAVAELECRWENASQTQPKGRKVRAPVLSVDLTWTVEPDHSFEILMAPPRTKPAKVEKDFATLALVTRGVFRGHLDEDGNGTGTLAYGSKRQFSEDVIELMEHLEGLIAYALVLHLPDAPVEEGAEWTMTGKSECGGPTCKDTTRSALTTAHDGRLVIATTYRYETVDHEYSFAKVPVWWGETKVVREIVPDSLLSDTTLDRDVQLELTSPKAWRKSRTQCHGVLRHGT